MFTLQYAKDPIWNNSEGTSILLTVKWEEFNEEMPFSATSYDSEAHGRDLFNRAKDGEFGNIGEYIPFGPSALIPITEITSEALLPVDTTII
jgi:hypothetical protein